MSGGDGGSLSSSLPHPPPKPTTSATTAIPIATGAPGSSLGNSHTHSNNNNSSGAPTAAIAETLYSGDHPHHSCHHGTSNNSDTNNDNVISIQADLENLEREHLSVPRSFLVMSNTSSSNTNTTTNMTPNGSSGAGALPGGGTGSGTAGRAALDSIASHLGNLRQRLTRSWQQHLQQQPDASPLPAESDCAGSLSPRETANNPAIIATPPHQQQQPPRAPSTMSDPMGQHYQALSERLNAADMAHARHMPLSLFHETFGSGGLGVAGRSMSQSVSSTNQSSIASNNIRSPSLSNLTAATIPQLPIRPSTTSFLSSAVSESKQMDLDDEDFPRMGKSGGSSHDNGDPDDYEGDCDIGSHAEDKASRYHRASTLMASRRRMEDLKATEMEVYEDGNQIATVAMTTNSMELQRDASAASAASPLATDHHDRDTPHDKDDDPRENEQDGGDMMGIEVSADDVIMMHESTSGDDWAFSTSKNSNSNDSLSVLAASLHQRQQNENERSLVYSWGVIDVVCGNHDEGNARAVTESSLHDDTVVRTTSDQALVDSKARIRRYLVNSASVGPKHTAVATASGEVLACGNNDAGQVVASHGTASAAAMMAVVSKPMVLESLAMTRVMQVSCGVDHTAAVTGAGVVLTWGSNAQGQLGQRIMPATMPSSSSPSSLPAMKFRPPAAMILGAGRRASAVACGHYFTLVLTSRMAVLACGADEIMSQRTAENQPALPEPLPALEALPISHIAAGAHHAVVVTCHGTAFAWGINDTGCCGREFPRTISVPVPVQLPVSTKVLLSYGASPFRNWAHWEGPGEPLSLSDDVSVVHAACGNGHSIFVTRSGSLLVCGLNTQGQLGVPSAVTTESDSGASFHHDDTNHNNITSVVSISHPEPGVKFTQVAAGEFHSLVLDSAGNVWQAGGNNCNGWEEVIAGQRITLIAAGGHQNIAIANPLASLSLSMHSLGGGRLFSIDAEASDGLMLVKRFHQLIDQCSQGIDAVKSKLNDLLFRTEELFRYPAVMNTFLDPVQFANTYMKLTSIGSASVQQSIASAMEKGMEKGLDELRSGEARLMYPEAVRCLLLYLQCPLWLTGIDVEFDRRGDVIISLCDTFLRLPFEGYRAAVTWATSLYPRTEFRTFLLQPLLAQLEKCVTANSGVRSRAIPVIVMVLRWLQIASERADNIVKAEDFYSTAISNMPPEALFEDLKRYKQATKSQRATDFFFAANPFLMSPICKRNLLQIEHQMDMVQAATSDVSFDVARRQFVFNPFFVLAIDRQYMLQQTLHKVAVASPQELRKSLKVVFKGEDGVDAGGVTKEFFQLLSAHLFDIATGMWATNLDDNNITWFNADCTWNDDGYYLVGVLVGLALYNSVILDVHFPNAVYRKLLGLPLWLEDMVDASVKTGLQKLLDYDEDDVEDVFCLSFAVTWMDLGFERSVELKPDGRNIPVTSDSKEEYVMLYVKWLLVDSIKRQYMHFERGLMRVLDGSCLDLLRPEELEMLITGVPELDFTALERVAEYEGGYDAETPVVRNFWRFAKTADTERQLNLLRFATGSAKAPIGGLGAMPFKIQRSGPDSLQLPTSHTCFNTLLLPDYGDNYEKLERLLGRAIMECEGFGLQ